MCLPLKNSQQCGSHCCQLLSSHRIEKVQHQSIESCDQETALPAGTNFGSRSAN